MDIYEVRNRERHQNGVYSGYGDAPFASFYFMRNNKVRVTYGDHIDLTDDDEDEDCDIEDLEDMDFVWEANKRR